MFRLPLAMVQYGKRSNSFFDHLPGFTDFKNALGLNPAWGLHRRSYFHGTNMRKRHSGTTYGSAYYGK